MANLSEIYHETLQEEQYFHKVGQDRLQESLFSGVLSFGSNVARAAIPLAAAAGAAYAGYKGGAHLGANAGAQLGKKVGEKVGRVAGRSGGALLASLAAGSIAYKVFHDLVAKKGSEPNKEQLLYELQKRHIEMQELYMRNNNGRINIHTMYNHDMNEKLLAEINSLRKEIDTVRALRESSELDEDLTEAIGGLAGKLTMGALKVGGKTALKGLQKLGGYAGKQAWNAGKKVASAAADDVTRAARATPGVVSKTANKAFSLAGKAVHTALLPSQAVGTQLSKISHPVAKKIGSTLSQATQEQAFKTVVAKPGAAGLADRARAAGKLITGASADVGIHSGIGAAAGAAGLTGAKSAVNTKPAPGAAHQGEKVLGAPNPATMTPQERELFKQKHPGMKMVFGEWRKVKQ